VYFFSFFSLFLLPFTVNKDVYILAQTSKIGLFLLSFSRPGQVHISELLGIIGQYTDVSVGQTLCN